MKPEDKASAMFQQDRPDWEENFQDLSGWCVTPTSHNAKDQYAVTTDELNTPMIELERKEFNFPADFSGSVPKFDSDLENNWENMSPQVDPYSPTVVASESATNILDLDENDTEFTTDYYDKKNAFISDNLKDDFVLKSTCAVPLALVEGKLHERDFHESRNPLIPETLNTPDIVRMLIEFPVNLETLPSTGMNQTSRLNQTSSRLNQTSSGLNHISAVVNQSTADLKEASTTAPMDSPSYDLYQPLPEIGEDSFDLLSYIVDDWPKQTPTTRAATVTVANEHHGKDMKKLLGCSRPLTTIAMEDLHSTPSTSHHVNIAITPQCNSRIKVEVVSEEEEEEEEVEVEVEEEEDETYVPLKRGQKRKQSKVSSVAALELPAKRSRRSMSTVSSFSGLTTVSASSDSKYRELRDRNNEASKKSRQSRKNRDKDMMKESVQLEKQNRSLKMRASEMEALVKKLRQALLTAVANNKK